MCRWPKIFINSMLQLVLLLGTAAAQESDTNDSASNANLLMKNAVELYLQAEVSSGQERQVLLRQVGEVLERIRSDFPESVPAEFMNDGKPLGPIDIVAVSAASEAAYLDDLPQTTISSVFKITGQACSSLAVEHCEQELAEALFEYITVLAFDLERAGNVEQLKWLFSNPGRFSDNLSRVNAFDELMGDEFFRNDFVSRVNSRIMAELGVEITADLAFSLLTGVVSETLAQHYEAQGYQEAADFTRTWMEPIVDISLLLQGVSSASTTGTGVGAAMIWAKNTYAFWQLGEKQSRAEQTGATADQQLELLAAEIESYTRTLISGQLTGAAFEGNEGAPLTEQHAEVLKSVLEQYYELQQYWLSSDDAVLLETFDAVLHASRAFYEAMRRLAEPTPLNPADSSGALPADLQDLGLQPAPNGFLEPPMLNTPSEPEFVMGKWSIEEEPDFRLKAGEQSGGFEISKEGQVSFSGTQLFGDYRTSGESRSLAVFINKKQTRAMALAMEDGAERFSLVDLEEGKVLNDKPLPFWMYGPTDDVMWDPSDRYVALSVPMAEYSKGLGVFDLETGQYSIIPSREFDASANDYWLPGSLYTEDDGKVSISVALQRFNADGSPIRSDDSPPQKRTLDFADFFVDVSHGQTQNTSELSYPNSWGTGVVPKSWAKLGYNPCGDRQDIRQCLHEKGLSDQAIDFSFAVGGDIAGQVFAIDFKEAGTVDVVQVEFNGASPHHWPVLVNGPLRELALEGTKSLSAVFTDPTSQKMLKTFPQATSRTAAVRSHRLLSDGTQRFVLVELVIDGCRACPVIGSAVTFLEIGPSTGGVLRRRPIGLFLNGPRASVDVSQGYPRQKSPSLESLRSNPSSLQASLNFLGYDAGEMDGYPGPQTRQALMEFQAEHCLSPSAQPDLATATAIINASGFETPCSGTELPDQIIAIDLLSCDPALQPDFPINWMNATLEGKTYEGKSWGLRLWAPGSSFGGAEFTDSKGNVVDGFWRPTDTGLCQSYNDRESWVCHDVHVCSGDEEKFVMRNDEGELSSEVSVLVVRDGKILPPEPESTNKANPKVSRKSTAGTGGLGVPARVALSCVEQRGRSNSVARIVPGSLQISTSKDSFSTFYNGLVASPPIQRKFVVPSEYLHLKSVLEQRLPAHLGFQVLQITDLGLQSDGFGVYQINGFAIPAEDLVGRSRHPAQILEDLGAKGINDVVAKIAFEKTTKGKTTSFREYPIAYSAGTKIKVSFDLIYRDSQGSISYGEIKQLVKGYFPRSKLRPPSDFAIGDAMYLKTIASATKFARNVQRRIDKLASDFEADFLDRGFKVTDRKVNPLFELEARMYEPQKGRSPFLNVEETLVKRGIELGTTAIGITYRAYVKTVGNLVLDEAACPGDGYRPWAVTVSAKLPDISLKNSFIHLRPISRDGKAVRYEPSIPYYSKNQTYQTEKRYGSKWIVWSN